MANKKQSTRCCKKKRKQLSIDRLSDLPDDVICHVLSFLPTKNSVRTSILAKRWRSLWAHVPCYDFDSWPSWFSKSMFRIINRFMLLRTKGVNINTFSLNHMGSGNSFEFETWIATLIAHNVQNLSLCLRFQFCLPQSLFSCKTLVDLRLTNCRLVIPLNCTFDLPSLKKLRLEELDMYESDNTLSDIISGCPVLEELIIKIDGYRSPLLCCCNISSTTLKRLDIITSHSRPHSYVTKKWYEVKLNTPTLTYLRLHDFASNDIISPCTALTSLIEADIHFFREESDHVIINSRSALEFVGTLCNVKHLKLSNCLVGSDDSVFSAVLTKMFHNLTKLVLEADWRFIPFFLVHAENLEALNIRMIDGRIRNWKKSNHVAVCVWSHLRNVTICDFGFKEAEFGLVRYILRNAKVMKRMEIHMERGDEDVKRHAVNRISKYCRGSEACELVFH